MSIDAHRYGDHYSEAGDDADKGTAAGPSVPDSSPDGAQAAARLLEMTARETDQWRADARSEAAAIVAGAREEAAELVRTAREEAERLVTAARDEAARATNDARVEAYRVREETTAVRKRHDEDIAHLKQVATDHRDRMRYHLNEMLRQVDSAPETDDR